MSKKLGEAVGSGAFVKALVYGKSGAGKTTFMTSFPGKMYVADFDGKITSAANYWNVHDKTRLDMIDYDNYMPSAENGGPKVYRKFLAWLSAAEQAVREGKFPYQSIGLDSLTSLADSLMANIILENPGLKRTEAMTPVMQDWMIFTPHFKQLIYRVLSLPAHICCVGHVLADKDEVTGIVTNQVALPGKLPDLMPKLFGEVYFAYTEMDNETKKLKHMALTSAPSDRFIVRTQIQGMPAKIPLSFKTIESMMVKKDEKQQNQKQTA